MPMGPNGDQPNGPEGLRDSTKGQNPCPRVRTAANRTAQKDFGTTPRDKCPSGQNGTPISAGRAGGAEIRRNQAESIMLLGEDFTCHGFSPHGMGLKLPLWPAGIQIGAGHPGRQSRARPLNPPDAYHAPPYDECRVSPDLTTRPAPLLQI